MSAVASLFLLPKSVLDGLCEAAVPKKQWLGAPKDTYWDYLKQHGRSVADYPWSGYALGTVLDWLEEEHQIDLMKSTLDGLSTFLSSTRGATHYVLSLEHRHAHLERLDPTAFSAEDFRRYYNEFHGTDEADLGTSMADAIGVLRQALAALDEKSVGLLIIG